MTLSESSRVLATQAVRPSGDTVTPRGLSFTVTRATTNADDAPSQFGSTSRAVLVRGARDQPDELVHVEDGHLVRAGTGDDGAAAVR